MNQEKIKSKKPEFIMPDVHRRKELKKRWRKPKGKQAKIRLRKRGHRRMPSQGYRAPKQVRGLREGLKEIIVTNINNLKNVKSDEGIIIAANVGKKKKKSIIKEATSKGIRILNIPQPEEYLKKIEMARKKKEKKEEKKIEKEKPAKKTIEELAEEKSEKEEREKEKLLTRREI